MSRSEVRKQLSTVIRASAERDRIRAANQKTPAFQRSSSHRQAVRRYCGDRLHAEAEMVIQGTSSAARGRCSP